MRWELSFDEAEATMFSNLAVTCTAWASILVEHQINPDK
jgi:hypothetical protein